MKYTNNKRYRRKTFRNRRKSALNIKVPFLVALCIISFSVFAIRLLGNRGSVLSYERAHYQGSIYQEHLKSDTLCVATHNVLNKNFQNADNLKAAALFQLNDSDVVFSKNIHEKVYPASTTKILTAYLALKYGCLTDEITISKEAVNVPLDSSRAGFLTGDKVNLETLLYGLMLPSGNDSAVAIAELISGSEEEFVKLMNDEANRMGATNTHFVNSHGYHDDNHYTTAYDLYLIFNECIKNEEFLEMISSSQYRTNITQKNGTYRTLTWKQSNQYINGDRSAPKNVHIIGGKTGTTDEAGACLILYSVKSESEPYISIVMGAENKAKLYENMTNLISITNK